MKITIKGVVKYALVFICGAVFGFVLCLHTCAGHDNGGGAARVREDIEDVAHGVAEAGTAVNRAADIGESIGEGIGNSQSIVSKLRDGAEQFENILQRIREREGIRDMDLQGINSDIDRRRYLFGG